jgi:hypothetical protein
VKSVPRTQGSGPTEDERIELERLRAEVAALRAEPRHEGGHAEKRVAGRGSRQRWRTLVAALLIVLACALAPL